MDGQALEIYMRNMQRGFLKARITVRSRGLDRPGDLNPSILCRKLRQSEGITHFKARAAKTDGSTDSSNC